MTVYKAPEYEQHPIAIDLMPGGMDEEEFNAFCEDIEQRGIIMPVTMYEGKVLDGWHRYRAGHKTGTPWKEIEYKGKDPAGYIASVNVLRRKLGSLQRALVGVRLHLHHNLTQREVCRKLGISNEVVNLVLRAVQSKNAKIVKRIETDTDFTRGMLREELEDAGLLRAKTDTTQKLGPNSVFAQGGGIDADNVDELLGGKGSPDTDGSADDDIGPIGDDKPLPDTGKKVNHKERKAKTTAAQLLADGFKALMADEKLSFLQIIYPEARVIMLEGSLLVGKVDNVVPIKPAKEPAATKKSLPAKKAKG